MTVYKPYGYRYGPIVAAHYLVDLTAMAALTINAGDILILSATVTGSVVTAAAGANTVLGIAMEKAIIGATQVLVNTSKEAVYEYPADAGSVTVAYKGLTCDVGGAQAIDFDTATDDTFWIQDVDVTNNTVFVKIAKQPSA